MPKSPAKTTPKDIDTALEDVISELKHAAEAVQDGAEDTLKKAALRLNSVAEILASQTRERSKALVKEAGEHPLIAATAVATAATAAAAAVVGLVLAARRAKAD